MPSLRRINRHLSMRSSDSPDTDSSGTSATSVHTSTQTTFASAKPSPLLSPKQIDRLSTTLATSAFIQNSIRSSHPSPHLPSQAPPSVHDRMPLLLPALFSSLAITDSKIAGHPIKLHSAAFVPGPQALKVGACDFLNPSPLHCDGQGVQSASLSVQMGDGDDGRVRFILQISGPLVDPASGVGGYALVSGVDVTEAVRGVAVERARTGNEGRLLPAGEDADADADADVDWFDFALAEEEEERARSSSHQPPNPHFSPLRLDLLPATHFRDAEVEVEAATANEAQTLASDPSVVAFLAMIQHVVRLHREYFVLIPTSAPPAGHGSVKYICDVAWLSPALLATDTSVRLATVLRALRGGDVRAEMGVGRPFSRSVGWGREKGPRGRKGRTEKEGKKGRMHCVPLFEGTKGRGWVCFLVDDVDEGENDDEEDDGGVAV